jgi:hypothetical protein
MCLSYLLSLLLFPDFILLLIGNSSVKQAKNKTPAIVLKLLFLNGKDAQFLLVEATLLVLVMFTRSARLLDPC